MTRSGEDVPTGAERQEAADGNQAAPSGGDLSSFDRAINDLQGRISDLRGSVDEIGRPDPETPPVRAPQDEPPPVSGVPTSGYEPPPPGYTPPAPPPSYAPQPASEPAYTPPPAYEPRPAYESPPAYEPPPAAYESPQPGYGQSPAAYESPPAAYEPPSAYEPAPAHPETPAELAPEPDPEVFLDSPSPATAMPAEGSDVLGSFSRVDVGPFEDLLAMTAFEEQLSALPSMADVRVRRFGAGRAEIQIETAGVVPVAREVMRVAPDARPAMQPDGSLIVELTDPRWTGGADAQAESNPAEPGEPGATAEGEAGAPRG